MIDENLWLEDIYGTEPLAWVKEQSDATLEAFAGPEFEALTDRLLEVIDSDDRLPIVSRRGEFLYGFWRDREHPRGLWRRTTLDSYRTDEVEWDVLLDVDALGREEDTEWVFAGARLLPQTLTTPDFSRALVSLSPDGGDAVTIREYDVVARAFVGGAGSDVEHAGFVVPTAKCRASWIDRDTLYVATDEGPGSMTTSSYPRTVKRWSRGQTISDAPIVHEVGVDDLTVSAHHDHTPGFERDVVNETVDFYRNRVFLLIDGDFVRLDLPEDADVDLHHEWLLVQPRSDWAVGDTLYATGSLLAMHLDAFLDGGRDFRVLFAPDPASALQSWAWTRSHLILTTLVDVASRIRVLTPQADGTWASRPLPGLPALSTLRVIGTDADADDPEIANEVWIHATGFLTPGSVLRTVLEAGSGADHQTGDEQAQAVETLKAAPEFFDASGLEVRQHWAVSLDGTEVPYFEVGRVDRLRGQADPVLLSGYGGFQASRLPDYSGVIGRAWLERGGVFVLANIRGGGEFGPAWHTSALKENRHRAYEDFAAIARDLVSRGVTTPEMLACEGRSNGGLLVGNMLTQYPELFGAVVCGVPLLDMQRYTHLSAGASWIAEYGDPDVPAEWEFVKTFSPYHLLRKGVDYPPTLIYAATSDDRVGPVQGRKMAARMHAMGIEGVRYFENDDGGHGGAVDNRASARLYALMYDFAWRATNS